MTISWSSLFAIFGALVTASTSLQDRQVTPDVVYSGLYSIRNCGQNATQVVDLLDGLWSILQPSLSDLSSTHASVAYQTFFKDTSYAPFINSILRNIAAGASVQPGQAAPGFSTSSPIITCVSTMPDPNDSPIPSIPYIAYISAITAGYQHCRTDPTLPIGAYIQGTPLIVICPFFWGIPAKPARKTCNRLNEAGNQFQGDGIPLAFTQTSVLFHELVHFYTEAASGIWSTYERLRLNDCVELNAEQSRLNPNNYVYYVFNILYKCRHFPSPNPSTDGRELLSSASNKTLDVIDANITLNTR